MQVDVVLNLEASALAGCGKNPMVVILSEAKNPSGIKTKSEEGFLAQKRRSE